MMHDAAVVLATLSMHPSMLTFVLLIGCYRAFEHGDEVVRNALCAAFEAYCSVLFAFIRTSTVR